MVRLCYIYIIFIILKSMMNTFPFGRSRREKENEKQNCFNAIQSSNGGCGYKAWRGKWKRTRVIILREKKNPINAFSSISNQLKSFVMMKNEQMKWLNRLQFACIFCLYRSRSPSLSTEGKYKKIIDEIEWKNSFFLFSFCFDGKINQSRW